MALNHMVQEIVQYMLGFRFFHPLNLRNKFTVKKETLLAGYRMNPNQWMNGLNGIFSNKTTRLTCVVDHFC